MICTFFCMAGVEIRPLLLNRTVNKKPIFRRHWRLPDTAAFQGTYLGRHVPGSQLSLRSHRICRSFSRLDHDLLAPWI
jgi:hypothetical protein